MTPDHLKCIKMPYSQNKQLYSKCLHTPIGEMVAVADKKALYFLNFTDLPQLDSQLSKLCKAMHAEISVHNECQPLKLIERELNDYFAGRLQHFTTPVMLLGSQFQKSAWQAITNIPYGLTKSYMQQAESVGRPTAYRAVANANGANRLVVIVPCHRIINNNGQLGGYGGGLYRKRWLLNHEHDNLSKR